VGRSTLSRLKTAGPRGRNIAETRDRCGRRATFTTSINCFWLRDGISSSGVNFPFPSLITGPAVDLRAAATMRGLPGGKRDEAFDYAARKAGKRDSNCAPSGLLSRASVSRP